MACRQIKTVSRDRLMEDPIFQTARQTLNQAIEDFKNMNRNLGLQVNPCAVNISQALSAVSNQQIQQLSPFTSQFHGPLTANVVEDRMTFKPDRFEIIMDVQGFTAENISIILQDNIVEVSAERQFQDATTAQCFSSRRRYYLPQNIRADALESNLSCDGILVLSAPWIR